MNNYTDVLERSGLFNEDIVNYIKKISTFIRDNKDSEIWLSKLPEWFWYPISAGYALVKTLRPVVEAGVDNIPSVKDWATKGDLKSFLVNAVLTVALITLFFELLRIRA
jgi:hypothetical protein